MIEGLRALPYLQEARREAPLDHKGKTTLLNCETCMQTTEPQQRQAMRCGYEPAVDGGVAWPGPQGANLVFEFCPGYTTQLPDVIDIADAYWWADKGAAGNLQDVAAPLRVGLRVLRDAIAECDAFKHRSKTKGGA